MYPYPLFLTLQEIVLGLLQAFVYDPMLEWVSGQSQRKAVDAHVAERLLVAHLTETSGVWVCGVGCSSVYVEKSPCV